jgi:hypothetical protein
MTTTTLLAPLIAARVTATADDDGHLLVRPAARITTDLRAYIRTHPCGRCRPSNSTRSRPGNPSGESS